MRYIHNVTVSVFMAEDEDTADAYAIFYALLPDIDFEKEKVSVEIAKAEGFDHKIIYFCSLKTHKQRHNKLVVETVFAALSKQDRQKLYRERESRMDDEGSFYLRLEKNALQEGLYRLTDEGDCFHMKIKLAAYPKTKENALSMFDQLWQKLLADTPD
jgi:hypothetical protein